MTTTTPRYDVGKDRLDTALEEEDDEEAEVVEVDELEVDTWWRGLEERLVGENPLEIERLWAKMYKHSIFYGGAGLIVSSYTAALT